MTPIQAALIMAAGGGLLVFLMIRSWRRQSKNTIAPLPAAPQGPWETSMEAIYVSTITAGQTFDRVGSHTLGQRSHCLVHTGPEGVLIEREGATDLFIPADRVQGIRRAAGMIGKTVGGEGLLMIQWAHDGMEFESGLRMRHRADTDTLVALLDRKEPSA